jgi:hypothetical protein
MTDQDRPGDDPSHDSGTSGRPASTDLPPSKHASGSTEPAIRQLDSMIENVSNYATPVLREIAARAAELAAKAADAAGPMAQKAAGKTEQVAGRVATKGREVASDLRRETAVAGSASGAPPLEPVEQTPAEEEAGLPPR